MFYLPQVSAMSEHDVVRAIRGHQVWLPRREASRRAAGAAVLVPDLLLWTTADRETGKHPSLPG